MRNECVIAVRICFRVGGRYRASNISLGPHLLGGFPADHSGAVPQYCSYVHTVKLQLLKHRWLVYLG